MRYYTAYRNEAYDRDQIGRFIAASRWGISTRYNDRTVTRRHQRDFQTRGRFPFAIYLFIMH